MRTFEQFITENFGIQRVKEVIYNNQQCFAGVGKINVSDTSTIEFVNDKYGTLVINPFAISRTQQIKDTIKYGYSVTGSASIEITNFIPQQWMPTIVTQQLTITYERFDNHVVIENLEGLPSHCESLNINMNISMKSLKGVPDVIKSFGFNAKDLVNYDFIPQAETIEINCGKINDLVFITDKVASLWIADCEVYSLKGLPGNTFVTYWKSNFHNLDMFVDIPVHMYEILDNCRYNGRPIEKLEIMDYATKQKYIRDNSTDETKDIFGGLL